MSKKLSTDNSLTQEELSRVYNAEDMLKGCISRMCICDTQKELNERYKGACELLSKIYRINMHRF